MLSAVRIPSRELALVSGVARSAVRLLPVVLSPSLLPLPSLSDPLFKDFVVLRLKLKLLFLGIVITHVFLKLNKEERLQMDFTQKIIKRREIYIAVVDQPQHSNHIAKSENTAGVRRGIVT